MSKVLGGQAFPRTCKPKDVSVPGMLLRDYFAAMAMQGMYANSCDDYTFEGVALAAYETADAMLMERNR